MTLVDPTAGLGYSFGQKLPSTHMTTIAANQPKAVDGDGGGTWTPSAPIILNGADALQLTGNLQLGGKVNYTSRTITRSQPYSMVKNDTLSPAGWVFTITGAGLSWFHNSNVAFNSSIHWLQRLVHNSTIASVKVYVQGATHPGSLPTARNTFELIKYNAGVFAAATVIGTLADNSAKATYESFHELVIPITTPPHTIDLSSNYGIRITPESGANSLAGLTYFGAIVEMAVTEQAEG